MTTAPGLTMLLVMNPGLPTAATRISALRVCWARFTVWLWQMVTVQFACSSSIAIGLPTDVAPPDDDRFFAVKVNPRAADHLHCALGCARNHARLSAHHPPRVE